MASCSVCAKSAELGLTVDGSKSNMEWSRILDVGETSVRRHWGHGEREDEPTGAKPEADILTGRAVESPDGGEFIDVQTLEPVNDWAEVFKRFNLPPEKFRIVDDTVRISTWQSSKRLENGERDIINLFSYKARFTRIAPDAIDIDPVAILARLRAERCTDGREWLEADYDAAASAFCLSINDIQLGQSYNGGSSATIARFHEFIEMAVKRIDELRLIGRRLDTLVIVGGGDLVEGCQIYPNQSFSLDLNRKQQIEGVVALLLHAIDTLAPAFQQVKVVAAAGNHGQNRINGNYTTMDDNDDTHAFEMVKLALSRDPDMQHIEWVIAESESGVTVNVFDWILATTHGDIYAKGVAGATIDKKAHAWMKNMALGRGKFGELGLADVLVGHHFHHEKSSDWGSCLWKQTPSQDRGSPYFEQASGEYSEPGMLTWVMTPQSRWKDEQVLR